MHGYDVALGFGQTVATGFTQKKVLFQAGEPDFGKTAETILLQLLLC
jgi:hypothetical protein